MLRLARRAVAGRDGGCYFVRAVRGLLLLAEQGAQSNQGARSSVVEAVNIYVRI